MPWPAKRHQTGTNPFHHQDLSESQLTHSSHAPFPVPFLAGVAKQNFGYAPPPPFNAGTSVVQSLIVMVLNTLYTYFVLESFLILMSLAPIPLHKIAAPLLLFSRRDRACSAISSTPQILAPVLSHVHNQMLEYLTLCCNPHCAVGYFSSYQFLLLFFFSFPNQLKNCVPASRLLTATCPPPSEFLQRRATQKSRTPARCVPSASSKTTSCAVRVPGTLKTKLHTLKLYCAHLNSTVHGSAFHTRTHTYTTHALRFFSYRSLHNQQVIRPLSHVTFASHSSIPHVLVCL